MRIKPPHEGKHKLDFPMKVDTDLLTAHHRMSMGMSPEPAVPASNDRNEIDPPCRDGYERRTHLSDEKGGRGAGHEGRELDKGPGY